MSSIVISGDTSGTITLAAPAIAGSNTLTLPLATDTLAGIDATQTLTNKTLVAPALGTVASGVISACTSTSMTMVSPLLGTPTSGVLTNCTGTANSLNAGIGVNQTWTSSAKVSGTVYTNSSGKPILVKCYIQINATSTLTIVVGGVTIFVGTQTTGTTRWGDSFIVPDGSTYSVTATSALSFALSILA